MAPKRCAASPPAAEGKKVKMEEERVGKRKADVHDDFQVHENYECTLNQTNIEDNKNKFYTMKVLTDGKDYWCRRKYARVGERERSEDTCHPNADEAMVLFEKLFSAKTGNDWIQRDNFVPHENKYTLIKLLWEEEFQPRPLDEDTQALIDFIFNHETVQENIQNMTMNPEMIPLGPLSQQQINKGYEILTRIQRAFQEENQRRLQKLSSKFYTNIPHNFGRTWPPVIDNAQIIEDKRAMLMALHDIVLLTRLEAPRHAEIPRWVLYYDHLNSQLNLLRRDTDNFQMIENYLKKTACSPMPSITNIWEVDRANEGERFYEHNGVETRKLLWYGTEVSSVVAILREGLKIMPHGGRVGRGIYFASEASVALTRAEAVDHVRVIFLSEVVLGRQAIISEDNENLMEPPEGHHSVVAQGKQSQDFDPVKISDPIMDITVQLDGREVNVPQGQPVEQPDYVNSSFDKSEYVIYKESQCRIRYLVLLKDNN